MRPLTNGGIVVANAKFEETSRAVEEPTRKPPWIVDADLFLTAVDLVAFADIDASFGCCEKTVTLYGNPRAALALLRGDMPFRDIKSYSILRNFTLSASCT